MKNDKIAEDKIDKEIAKRTNNGYMHIYHITGISRMINGITIVSLWKLNYLQLLVDITDEAYSIDADAGDVFPSDMRRVFNDLQRDYTGADIGVAICDHRDQYNPQEGRTIAKRNWLETYRYEHTIIRDLNL